MVNEDLDDWDEDTEVERANSPKLSGKTLVVFVRSEACWVGIYAEIFTTDFLKPYNVDGVILGTRFEDDSGEMSKNIGDLIGKGTPVEMEVKKGASFGVDLDDRDAEGNLLWDDVVICGGHF